MKKKILLSIALLLLFSAGAAFADPKSGFSVNAGLASHSMSIANAAPAFSYDSSGLSLGIDYQIALSKSFSLNPFLMTSGETVSGYCSGGLCASPSTEVTSGHGIIGLQLRYWINDIFVGGHITSYSEVLDNGTSNVNASGPGAGLAVGWEKHDGGLYVMGQLDGATLKYSDADVDLSGVRLSVGYRWK